MSYRELVMLLTKRPSVQHEDFHTCFKLPGHISTNANVRDKENRMKATIEYKVRVALAALSCCHAYPKDVQQRCDRRVAYYRRRHPEVVEAVLKLCNPELMGERPRPVLVKG